MTKKKIKKRKNILLINRNQIQESYQIMNYKIIKKIKITKKKVKKIKLEKEKIIQMKSNFNKFKLEYNKEYLKIKEKNKNWIENKENQKDKINNEIQRNKNIIIDVGGVLQTISYKTLIKYPNSVLGALFNNHIKIPKRKGNIFIDRDPKIFSLMCYYLSNLSLPNFIFFFYF